MLGHYSYCLITSFVDDSNDFVMKVQQEINEITKLEKSCNKTNKENNVSEIITEVLDTS